MSWDKNTISSSNLDATKELLKELGYPYTEEFLGVVKALGFNDDVDYFTMRRLEYNRFVILERMERDRNCDTDDIIRAHKFPLKDEPREWAYYIEVGEP